MCLCGVISASFLDQELSLGPYLWCLWPGNCGEYRGCLEFTSHQASCRSSERSCLQGVCNTKCDRTWSPPLASVVQVPIAMNTYLPMHIHILMYTYMHIHVPMHMHHVYRHTLSHTCIHIKLQLNYRLCNSFLKRIAKIDRQSGILFYSLN